MGGRSGPSRRQILGPGRRGRSRSSGLEDRLLDAGSNAVAVAAFQTVAASNPVIGAAYLAYEVAKFTYPIVTKGLEEYQKSGNSDRAIEKMGETLRQTGKKIGEAAVGNIVSGAMDGAMKAANIKPEGASRTFVEAAVTETINNLIEPHGKKR